MKKWMPIFVFVLAIAICALAHACPACKDSVPNSDAEAAGNVPGGFNNSVYFMLGSFITMVGFVTTFLVRTCRGTTMQRGFPLD
jgi:hypothetical protein